jgi:hypothetical protein
VSTRTSVKLIKYHKAFLTLLRVLGDCVKKCQQAFLALLPGKVVWLFKEEYLYHLHHTDVMKKTIYLYSNRLTLGLSNCVSYAR